MKRFVRFRLTFIPQETLSRPLKAPARLNLTRKLRPKLIFSVGSGGLVINQDSLFHLTVQRENFPYAHRQGPVQVCKLQTPTLSSASQCSTLNISCGSYEDR